MDSPPAPRRLVRLFRRTAPVAALLAAWLAPWIPARAADADLRKLDGVRRILFLGDSITQAGDYVVDAECWLVARGARVEVLNLGLGSETASDLTPEENAGHLQKFGFGRPFVSERLARVLTKTQPDMLFACYGMNDAGSLPPTAEGTRRFLDAVTQLRAAALAAGVRRVVIATPPVKEANEGEWKENVHDQNIGRYTEALLAKKKEGWDVVDVHTPMRKALDRERRKNPAFAFAKDTVHPGREGHWVMATCLLEQFFGASLGRATCAEDFFPAGGAEIRAKIRERSSVRFNAWMTAIGHGRPGVPGGPKAKPGPSIEAAEAQAAALTAEIDRLAGAKR
jgi:lysophospholipase L1-like esterase